MQKRVVLVTGGMGGLGESICLKLADLGYIVVTTYSPSNKTADAWVAGMRERGYHFHAHPVDVSDPEDCARMAAKVVAEVGQVDVLVNNAGITRDMTFKKMTKVDWDAVINTNLNSVFNMTKPFIDGMVDRGWGRVINVSSVNGQKGAFGQTNYAAAKAGMHGFTKALALEVARKGVTVNTVSPGYTRTDQVAGVLSDPVKAKMLADSTLLKRLGEPDDIGDFVRALSGGAGRWVTGQLIEVSGGFRV